MNTAFQLVFLKGNWKLDRLIDQKKDLVIWGCNDCNHPERICTDLSGSARFTESFADIQYTVITESSTSDTSKISYRGSYILNRWGFWIFIKNEVTGKVDTLSISKTYPEGGLTLSKDYVETYWEKCEN